MRIPRDPYSIVVAVPIGGGLEAASQDLARTVARCSVEDGWPYEVLGSKSGEVWIALSRTEEHDQVEPEELAAEAVGGTGSEWRIIKFGH